MVESAFKVCPACRRRWATRDDFLADPGVEVIGYQANFTDLELGYFLFIHASCQTSFAIEARTFRDFYEGPVFQERKTGSDECSGFCRNDRALDPCDVKCECAWVRHVLKEVRRRLSVASSS